MTLHEVALATYPIGIICHHCMHQALVTAQMAKAQYGDMRTLEEAEVGGRGSVPPSECVSMDWNDYAARHGREATASAIRRQAYCPAAFDIA